MDIGFTVANECLARQVQHLLTRFGIVSKLQYRTNDCAGAWQLTIRDHENMQLFVDEIGFLFSKQEKAAVVLQNKQGKQVFS